MCHRTTRDRYPGSLHWKVAKAIGTGDKELLCSQKSQRQRWPRVHWGTKDLPNGLRRDHWEILPSPDQRRRSYFDKRNKKINQDLLWRVEE